MDDIAKARSTKAKAKQSELDAKIMARADHLVVSPTDRAPLPKDVHGQRWAYDWRGRAVNLWETTGGDHHVSRWPSNSFPGSKNPSVQSAIFLRWVATQFPSREPSEFVFASIVETLSPLTATTIPQCPLPPP